MAVLPVWRSPMISSRWPRPMGIMASMALMPVCIGSFTGWRATTPGARRSTGLNCGGLDRALAVDGLAQRIHHAADQRLAHRHRHDAPGAPHLVAFLDLGEVAQQHGAHLVFLQVHGDARHVVRELDQLARHDLFQAMDAGDAVAHGDDRADLGDVDRPLVVLDLLAENAGYFVRSNLSHNILPINLPRSGGVPGSPTGRAPSRRRPWSRSAPPRRRSAPRPPRTARGCACR